jgi:uncharacterized membrane protein YecN with MAPEG domain
MTNLHWVAVYAGAQILLLLALALGVVGARRREKILLGDGDNPSMRRAIRVHANATEYVPAALVGMAILALLPDPAPAWVIHAIGGGLLVSRLAHAIGLSGSEGPSPGRVIGTLGTWLVFLGVGGALVWYGAAPISG